MAGPPRSDLRHYEELRPMMVEFGIAPEATSSVIVSQGKTKVSVSVYGPSQPRYMRHEEYDKCTLDIEYRANYNASTTNRNIIENDGMTALKKVLEPALLLEQFPRMMILMKVNILQDDGSLDALVLNACTLALCKSGIPMSYMPVSYWVESLVVDIRLR
jgi:exosome complex component RRP41